MTQSTASLQACFGGKQSRNCHAGAGASRLRSKWWVGWLRRTGCIALLVIVLGGCSERPITVQSVPAEQSGYAVFRRGSSDDLAANQNRDQVVNRMLVAWFDQAEGTWFFKVNGPQAAVDADYDQIETFFNSISFSDGQPDWQQPDSWVAGPKRMMRYATLVVNEATDLEIAVSRLPPEQDRLFNVNRWLGQLGIPAVDKDGLSDRLKQPAGVGYLLFDATGQGSGQMGRNSKAPFANAPFLKKMTDGAKQGPSEIQYTAPQGWTAKRVTGMVPGVRFTDASSDPPTTITATRMVGAANKWTPNALRWAGQVGQSLTADQIEQATEAIQVGGVDGQLIMLGGTEQGILGTLVFYGDDAWFFKLMADNQTVSQQEQVYRDLLKSIRFK